MAARGARFARRRPAGARALPAARGPTHVAGAPMRQACNQHVTNHDPMFRVLGPYAAVSGAAPRVARQGEQQHRDERGEDDPRWHHHAPRLSDAAAAGLAERPCAITFLVGWCQPLCRQVRQFAVQQDQRALVASCIVRRREEDGTTAALVR
eukprot:COSAG02_NODE_772_length_17359_cov_74.661587_11_plen_152_part_00